MPIPPAPRLKGVPHLHYHHHLTTQHTPTPTTNAHAPIVHPSSRPCHWGWGRACTTFLSPQMGPTLNVEYGCVPCINGISHTTCSPYFSGLRRTNKGGIGNARAGLWRCVLPCVLLWGGGHPPAPLHVLNVESQGWAICSLGVGGCLSGANGPLAMAAKPLSTSPSKSAKCQACPAIPYLCLSPWPCPCVTSASTWPSSLPHPHRQGAPSFLGPPCSLQGKAGAAGGPAQGGEERGRREPGGTPGGWSVDSALY